MHRLFTTRQFYGFGNRAMVRIGDRVQVVAYSNPGGVRLADVGRTGHVIDTHDTRVTVAFGASLRRVTPSCLRAVTIDDKAMPCPPECAYVHPHFV